MTCIMLCTLAALAGAFVGFAIATMLWVGRRHDDDLDSHAIDELEIVISSKGDRVWVNAGVCIGRWYGIKHLTLDDRRGGRT
jgi:hypothetical protein